MDAEWMLHITSVQEQAFNKPITTLLYNQVSNRLLTYQPLFVCLTLFLLTGFAFAFAQDKPESRKHKKANFAIDRMVDSSCIQSTIDDVQALMMQMIMLADLTAVEETLGEEENESEGDNDEANRRTRRNRNRRNRSRRTNSDRRLTRNRYRYRRTDTQDDMPLA